MKITSMKGRQIDIAALRESNGATIALGNARVNARGDLLGRGGVVVKTKENVVKDYYDHNPKAVTVSSVSLKDLSDEVGMTPKQAMAKFDEKVAEVQKAAPSKRKLSDSED